jgi:hypothetical protein
LGRFASGKVRVIAMGAFEIAPGKEKYTTYFSGVIDKGIFLPAADYHNYYILQTILFGALNFFYK